MILFLPNWCINEDALLIRNMNNRKFTYLIDDHCIHAEIMHHKPIPKTHEKSAKTINLTKLSVTQLYNFAALPGLKLPSSRSSNQSSSTKSGILFLI